MATKKNEEIMEANGTGIVINVYGEDGEIVKTSEAVPLKLKFKTVRKIMQLLNIDTLDDTNQLLAAVYNAWGELIVILNQCFPDMTDEDWDDVDMTDLLPALLGIISYSFGELLTVPKDPTKN